MIVAVDAGVYVHGVCVGVAFGIAGWVSLNLVLRTIVYLVEVVMRPRSAPATLFAASEEPKD